MFVALHPITDMDEQYVIYIVHRPEAVGKEKVYYTVGTSMKFG